MYSKFVRARTSYADTFVDLPCIRARRTNYRTTEDRAIRTRLHTSVRAPKLLGWKESSCYQGVDVGRKKFQGNKIDLSRAILAVPVHHPVCAQTR